MKSESNDPNPGRLFLGGRPLARDRHLTRLDALRGAVGLGLWVVSEQLIARTLNLDFLGWYIGNAPVIGLISTLIGLAWDLDRFPGLINPWPQRYREEWSFLLIRQMGALFSLLEAGDERFMNKFSDRYRPWLDSIAARPALHGVLFWPALAVVIVFTFIPEIVHYAMSLLWVVAMAVALVSWYLVINPIQYFVYLVCGVLPRVALLSNVTSYVTGEDDLYDLQGQSLLSEKSSKSLPKNVEEVGFVHKPVTFTTILSTLFLWGVSYLI